MSGQGTGWARALAIGGSMAVAGALGFLLWDRSREPDLFEVRSVETEVLSFLAARAVPPTDPPRPIAVEPFTESDARLICTQLSNASNVFDPLLGFRYRPHFERRFEYPEHPDGGWWLRTNALGLRMDDEVAVGADVQKPDLRVLVVGDSHTDGICNNAEAFPHLLAELLAARLAPRAVEVLNAGKSGYSFYNYLAAPAAFAELEPDLLIVCMYAGNDFNEVVLPHLYHQRLAPPPIAAMGEERLNRAFADLPAGVAPQGLMQSMLFRTNPHLEVLARDGARRVTLALAQDCASRNLPWIGVLIPPMADVQPAHLSQAYRRAERELELEPRDLASAGRLGDEWLALVESASVPRLDLRPVLRAADTRLYWESDHHLDLEAHVLVADALLTVVLETIERSGTGTGDAHGG